MAYRSLRETTSTVTGSKQRPGVVVSSPEHQRSGHDLIVAAISGQRVDHPGAFDHVVAEWKTVGLLMPSVVRCGKLVTLERTMVRRPLGRMSSSDFREIMATVGRALAAHPSTS